MGKKTWKEKTGGEGKGGRDEWGKMLATRKLVKLSVTSRRLGFRKRKGEIHFETGT